MDDPRPSQPPRRRFRRGCRPCGHHAGLRLGRPHGRFDHRHAAGFVCLWAVVWLKAKLGYDDALDVFGVHGIGGILGALLTGYLRQPGDLAASA